MFALEPETRDLLVKAEAVLDLVVAATKTGPLRDYRRRGYLSSRAKWLLKEIYAVSRAERREQELAQDLDAEPTAGEKAAIEARAAEARRAKIAAGPKPSRGR